MRHQRRGAVAGERAVRREAIGFGFAYALGDHLGVGLGLGLADHQRARLRERVGVAPWRGARAGLRARRR